MAQKLFQDKISTLSEAGGIITMSAGAIMTIGGQQYTTTAPLQVTPVGLIVQTYYRIYATVSGGVVSLVVSANNNSTGPAGHTAWKLVGHFLNTRLGNIKGVSEAIDGKYVNMPPIVAKIGVDSTTTTGYSNAAAKILFDLIIDDPYDLFDLASNSLIVPKLAQYQATAGFGGSDLDSTSRLFLDIRRANAGNIRGYNANNLSNSGINATGLLYGLTSAGVAIDAFVHTSGDTVFGHNAATGVTFLEIIEVDKRGLIRDEDL
jgi:hypothetical protein